MSEIKRHGPQVQDVTTAEFKSVVVDGSRERAVLVDFWAPWCAPCRSLGPILEKLAAEYDGGFLLAKVDTEAEPALGAQFQIRSIPTVMLFKNGEIVTGFQGALPEGQIRQFLTKNGIEPGGATPLALSADPVERLAQLQAAVADSPERDSLKLELALALLDAGTLDEASHALEALPMPTYEDAKAVRARARVALLRRLNDDTGDVQHKAAVQAVLKGDLSAGLDQLLGLLRDEKLDEHSAARAALVEAFQMIEDENVVRDWRRRMAAVLF